MTAIQPSRPQSPVSIPSAPSPFDYLERVLTSSVYDVVSETPLERAILLSDRVSNTVWLKREDTTAVKSFKLRGAYNMIARADPKLLSNGVIAASAGNHAQGVALAARRLGIPAKIIMPAVTPEIKINAVRRLGANAVLHGDTFDAAKARALRLAEASGALFVPPFDHPDIIAGQGTVGLELIRQSANMDAIFIPVGGGGLIAGIAAVIKRLRPNVKIIGVEPEDANAMYVSLQQGQRVKLDRVGTFADGVAVAEVGEETFRICKGLVDEVILVSTDEICASVKDMFEDTRSILEPAGALAVAGVKKYVEREHAVGQNLVAITSGANTNFDRLRNVSERAEIGEGREGILAVTIPEQAKAFKNLINVIGSDVSFTEFNYRCSSEKEAHVFIGMKITSPKDVEDIISRLHEAGINSIDLSANEMAKLHVRHLVGGNATIREFDEAVFRFEFPERPGALLNFLVELPDGFNITMFHYRNHGADVGRVLVGFTSNMEGGHEQETKMLDDFVGRLGYNYSREDDNMAYKFFLGKRT